MWKSFFDHEDDEFLHTLSGSMAMDSEGGLMMRLSGNMAMDMDSGDIHIVSSWSSDDEND